MKLLISLRIILRNWRIKLPRGRDRFGRLGMKVGNELKSSKEWLGYCKKRKDISNRKLTNGRTLKSKYHNSYKIQKDKIED